MNDVLLEIKSLNKSYGGNFPALKDVSLQIREGELTVILGSSGSGKSTLLNLIGSIDKPDSGEILYNGTDIVQAKDRFINQYRRDDVGFIFQSFNLINDLTVLENISLQSSIVKDAKDPIEILRLVDLEDKKNSYPKELSGGQQQRVSIARALIKPHAFLLCDEPTGALDYETGKRILSLFERIVKEEKRTVIFVTHTREIAKMADYVINMRSGKVESAYRNENKAPAAEIEW